MKRTVVCWLVLAGLALSAGLTLAAESPPLVSIAALRQLLADPQVLVVDVRSSRDWNASTIKIAGAKRMNPGDTGWILAEPKDRKVVFYCA